MRLTDHKGANIPTQLERRTHTRSALLGAARQRFAAVGFDAVTIDELAAEVGMTRGAVYHHFEGKEALFEAVFEEVETELAVDVAVAVSKHATKGALIAGCNAYIRLASSSSVARIVLIDAPAVLGPVRYRAIDEHHFLPMVETAIQSLQPTKSKRALRPLSRAVFAAICELALEAHFHPESIRDIGHAVTTLTAQLTDSY